MIRRNVELESRLIDDLLDLTRISSGKLQLHVEPTDVHKLIGNAAAIYQKDAAAKRLALTLDLAAAAARAAGRPGPAAAGLLEPDRQRGEVHPRRRQRLGAHGAAARAITGAMAPAAGDPRRGDRHRHRDRAVGDGPAVHRVRAGGDGADATVRRAGAGTDDLPGDRRTARRHDPRPQHRPRLRGDDDGRAAAGRRRDGRRRRAERAGGRQRGITRRVRDPAAARAAGGGQPRHDTGDGPGPARASATASTRPGRSTRRWTPPAADRSTCSSATSASPTAAAGNCSAGSAKAKTPPPAPSRRSRSAASAPPTTSARAEKPASPTTSSSPSTSAGCKMPSPRRCIEARGGTETRRHGDTEANSTPARHRKTRLLWVLSATPQDRQKRREGDLFLFPWRSWHLGELGASGFRSGPVVEARLRDSVFPLQFLRAAR